MNGTSLQKVDPIGALAGRRLTLTAAVAVVVISIGGALMTPADTGMAAALILAVSLYSAAALALVDSVVRGNGMLGRTTALSVLALGALGLLAASAGAPVQTSGADWAPYPLAILLLALVPYRPVAEMAIASLALAIWAASAVTSGSVGIDDPPEGYRQVIAALPILALPLGGVAFSSHVLRFLARWRRNALDATAVEARQQEGAITRAVQQTRVTILNREVVPFFAELAARGEIHADDRDRARQLAESIRSIMVADIDRSWLDDLVRPRDPLTGRTRGRSEVEDPEELATLMDLDQRSAMRALLGLLGDLAGDGSDRVAVSLASGSDGCEVSISSPLAVSARDARYALQPYIAVMATVFSDLGFQIRDDTLTMRFCYDRP